MRTGLGLLALLLLGNGAPPPSAAELVAAVQEHYDAVQDISARFEQEARVASLGKVERSSGSVTIQRPGRMRWEYSGPEPRVIALDGDSIRMYLPEDEQLQIAPLSQAAFPPTALDFLLGTGKLGESFEAEGLGERAGDELGLRLRPRSDASFDHLEIWVSRDGRELRESIVVDLFGNRTAVRFTEMTENQGVAADAFQIDVPAGTEVFDLRENP